MAKYRKRPVVIEAHQWFPQDNNPKPDWLAAAIREGSVYYQGGDDPYLTVETLEGDHRATPGDWIIQGVKGELYPCKPDIFAATYEAAD